MSGDSKEEGAHEWMWAHLLWQRRGIRMEEFADMPREIQLAYIASETLAIEKPLKATDRLAKAYLKPKT